MKFEKEGEILVKIPGIEENDPEEYFCGFCLLSINK
jgi:hypothetical protein